MPKSLRVLPLIAAVVAVAAGAAGAAAPVAPHREPGHDAAVRSRVLTLHEVPAPRRLAPHAVRPLTIALLDPAATPGRTPAARPAPQVRRHVATTHRPARTSRTAGTSPTARTSRLARPAPRLTFQQQVERAVARIPGYRPGSVIWVLQANGGHWGRVDLYAHTIWISPRVPSDRLFDVVVHEWSHLQSVAVYGGDGDAAISAMNQYFGGSDLVGAERAADCMARLQSARWTHYTPCTDSHWRAGAARLLAGQRL